MHKKPSTKKSTKARKAKQTHTKKIIMESVCGDPATGNGREKNVIHSDKLQFRYRVDGKKNNRECAAVKRDAGENSIILQKNASNHLHHLLFLLVYSLHWD